MKLGQVKVPEIAMDGLTAWYATQIDHSSSHAGPTDSYHGGSTPDLIPGLVVGGLHTLVGAGVLIKSANSAYNSKASAGPECAQGVWELVKAGGFGMQIAPGLGMLGAGLVACGTLGDVCSGWVTEPLRSWKANKANGPQGCAGPED